MPYFDSQSRPERKVGVLFHATVHVLAQGRSICAILPWERTRQHAEAEQPADVIVSFADVE
jgi:hypothetical protein